MTGSATNGTATERRIEQLDLTLFDHVSAQLERDDRRSLLALHLACRKAYGSFRYLEIGSHLGGSLQVLVCDPACAGIVSVDPRPAWQPDERGVKFAFPENSTARMLSLLRAIPGADVEKIHPLDASTENLRAEQLPLVPQLSFIDGEHTDDAALRDARFCLAAMRDGDGAIVFHDAVIVYRGISRFLAELGDSGVPFTPYFLASSVFVVEIGVPVLRDVAAVTEGILQNYKGYLFGLDYNDGYRAFYNRPVFRAARRVRALLRSNGIFR